MNIRDCHPNWKTCPIEKRVWFENNMESVEAIMDKVVNGEWIFRVPGIKQMAVKMKKEGIFSIKSGTADVQGWIGRHLMKAYGISWDQLYSKKIVLNDWDRLGGLPEKYKKLRKE